MPREGHPGEGLGQGAEGMGGSLGEERFCLRQGAGTGASEDPEDPARAKGRGRTRPGASGAVRSPPGLELSLRGQAGLRPEGLLQATPQSLGVACSVSGGGGRTWGSQGSFGHAVSGV